MISLSDKNIVKLFYILYTVYLLLVTNVTNLTIGTLLPSILLMWLNYFAFSLGYIARKGAVNPALNANVKRSFLISLNDTSLVAISSVSILFSVLVVRFYTGQTPITSFSNLITGNSLYYLYQSYFAENQLSEFSLRKLPYIFMFTFVKFILLYSWLTFFIEEPRLTGRTRIYLATVMLAYVYVGISRGTGFELFEIAVMIIFIALKRATKSTLKVYFKKFIGTFIVIALVVIAYDATLNARTAHLYYRTSEFWHDEDSIIYILFPVIARLVLRLYDYFGFGFYLTAKYVSEIWLRTLDNFFAGVLPLGTYAMNLSHLRTLLSNIVDIGPRWVPDTIIFINYFGFFGLLFLCFILGYILRSTAYMAYYISPSLAYLMKYFIILQMLSLPVGNFVNVSSASKLIILFSFIYYAVNKTLYKKFRNNALGEKSGKRRETSQVT